MAAVTRQGLCTGDKGMNKKLTLATIPVPAHQPKRDISTRLEAIVAVRLFGDGNWLVDRESGPALSKVLQEMGLEEQLPNDPKTTRSTSLGKEFNIDLQMVFMGLWEPWDMIFILEEHELIDTDEVDTLVDLLNAEKYSDLRTRVKQAYRDYHKACQLRSAPSIAATTSRRLAH
jgi:hypothetical protein